MLRNSWESEFMGKLSAFLKPAPSGKKREVYVSDRFVGDDGKPVPFIVQTITPEENEELSRMCMDETGRLDAARYGNRLIVACTVEPNLKDSELCKFYGVMDPLEVPGIMFTIGEKQILQDAIMDINDVKKAREKLLDAKNSLAGKTGK